MGAGRMVLVLAFAVSAMARGECTTQLKAGLRTLHIGNTTATVWYPTTAAASFYSYSESTNGVVAQNAPIATCDVFPMVVFSHGTGGCSTQTVFLTEELARRGYVVAAPEHLDSSCGAGDLSNVLPFTEPELWNDQSSVDRRNDIAATLDFMLGDMEFGPRIDASRIGGSGHSLGGYTIFGMAGGWDAWHDLRIKAALLLSPFVDPYLLQGQVPNVNMPLIYQGGTLDLGITPSLRKPGGAYDSSHPPKYYLELVGAGHFEWTNLSCRPVSTSVQCLHLTNPGLIVEYGIAFLDRYLKGVQASVLYSGSPQLADYRRNTPVSVVSGANLKPGALTPSAIGVLLGEGLASSAMSAPAPDLPVVLGGASVMVRDADGVDHLSPLYSVASGEITFVMTPGASTGPASVVVRDSNGKTISSGGVDVATIAPAVFVANPASQVAAGLYSYVTPNGDRDNGLVFRPLTLLPVPLPVTPGELYLSLYATGVRSANLVSATIGGIATPVTGFAPQAQHPGMDQVKLGPLPAELAGQGLSDIVLTFNGVAADPVQVRIQ